MEVNCFGAMDMFPKPRPGLADAKIFGEKEQLHGAVNCGHCLFSTFKKHYSQTVFTGAVTFIQWPVWKFPCYKLICPSAFSGRCHRLQRPSCALYCV